jgi:hypothetical protein
MNCARTLAAAFFALAAPIAAAQLDGTVLDIEQNFCDSLTQDLYTYGKTQTFTANNDPNRTWKATSPANEPGYSNSILCNYANYSLGQCAGTDTYFFFRDLDIQPEKGSAVAINSAGDIIAKGSDQDFGFWFQISVDDILAGPHDRLVIAWNNEGGFECYPDLDDDGELSLFDFLAYVNLFNEGDEGADCDADGDLTLFDFLCYTNAFNAGC